MYVLQDQEARTVIAHLWNPGVMSKWRSRRAIAPSLSRPPGALGMVVVGPYPFRISRPVVNTILASCMRGEHPVSVLFSVERSNDHKCSLYTLATCACVFSKMARGACYSLRIIGDIFFLFPPLCHSLCPFPLLHVPPRHCSGKGSAPPAEQAISEKRILCVSALGASTSPPLGLYLYLSRQELRQQQGVALCGMRRAGSCRGGFEAPSPFDVIIRILALSMGLPR